jgi:hypothetical protein
MVKILMIFPIWATLAGGSLPKKGEGGGGSRTFFTWGGGGIPAKKKVGGGPHPRLRPGGGGVVCLIRAV